MSFNGATAFQPWKWIACPLICRGWERLQWGHGFSAVEMGNAATLPRRAHRFNGATAFQPWKS